MKPTKKDCRITVRLTPHQDFMLDEISKELDKPKAQLLRYMIENFTNKYNENRENN